MMFSEVEFAYFIPLVVLGYWLLPRRASWQNAWLLAASYLFYSTWSMRLLPLLIAATLVDYALAIGIERSPDGGRRRKLLLGLSVAANLGVLGFFKYAGFFAGSFNLFMASIGLDVPLPVLRLLLPLGVSFYTLQKLGYVIDVYYGRMTACRSLPTFALFVAFFPQITAGPISRSRQLLPQLESDRHPLLEAFQTGTALFIIGFVHKAFVADTVGRVIVSRVLASPGDFGVAAHWAALFGYAIQVYADFAGYSLMAIGCARWFGLELPQNFNLPYASRSLFEFWRRWHITLNTWLFDYIYFPLTTGTGPMRGKLATGLMITFLISGLWHGAALTFVCWGLFHGIGLVINLWWEEFYKSLCRRDRKWVARRASRAYRGASWLLTQSFFLFSLVLFAAPDMATAGSFARGLLTSSSTAFPELPFNPRFRLLVAVAAFLLFHLPLSRLGQSLLTRFNELPSPVRGFAWGALIVALGLLVPVSSGAFIYRNF